MVGTLMHIVVFVIDYSSLLKNANVCEEKTILQTTLYN